MNSLSCCFNLYRPVLSQNSADKRNARDELQQEYYRLKQQLRELTLNQSNNNNGIRQKKQPSKSNTTTTPISTCTSKVPSSVNSSTPKAALHQSNFIAFQTSSSTTCKKNLNNKNSASTASRNSGLNSDVYSQSRLTGVSNTTQVTHETKKPIPKPTASKC